MNYVVFFAWVFAFYNRLSHAGRVCSGDYLEDGDSTAGFLIMQGLFIKYAIVALLGALTIAVTYILCTLIRAPRMHIHEE